MKLFSYQKQAVGRWEAWAWLMPARKLTALVKNMPRRWKEAAAMLALMLTVLTLTVPLCQPGRAAADDGAWIPMDSGTTASLYSVWGSSSDDVFAVGSHGTILHYDGSAWNTMSITKPLQGGTIGGLKSVWGSSCSDVFAVGEGGIILHYDGSTWSSMNADTPPLLLYDIWGSSSSDVFAVGLREIWMERSLLHYDGATWNTMSSGTTLDLCGIWGNSSSDVFAVGEGSIILHYDGSTWNWMDSGVSWTTLRGVWGTSSSDVFVVGDYGTIVHYDGSKWNSMSSGTTRSLWDVWGSSSSAADVFAVGSSGTILRYDGSKWSSMSSGTTQSLHGVWGSSSSDVFAVGHYGSILHYMGPRRNTLTVTVSPGGGGTVTPSPSQPAGGYVAGTEVTLTASASEGHQFDHWSGDASGTSPTTSVTMTSDKSITANFSEVAPEPTTPPPASFTVSNLSIEPAEVESNETVVISVLVANTGGSEGSYNVALEINGGQEQDKSVTVAAGDSESITFNVAKEQPGSYLVDVNGLTGSFVVKEETAIVPPPAPPPSGETFPPYSIYIIGGVLGGAALIGTSTRYFLRRRSEALLLTSYKQKVEQWEEEGYDVSEFKNKWFG